MEIGIFSCLGWLWDIVLNDKLLTSFSLFYLLFGREPELPLMIRREVIEVVNLDDPQVWSEVCGRRALLF